MDDGLSRRLGHRHPHAPSAVTARPRQRSRASVRRRCMDAAQATRCGFVRRTPPPWNTQQGDGACASTTNCGMVLMHLKTEAKRTSFAGDSQPRMTAFRSRERSVTLDEGDAGDAAHRIHLQTAPADSRGHRAAASSRCQDRREYDAARNVAPPACKRSTDRPPSSKTKTAHISWAVVLTLRALAPTKQAMPAGANNNSRRRRRSAQPTDWRTQR